ncbi:MAG: hypothetical protein ACK5LS_06125 [Propioniciclava sp.]
MPVRPLSLIALLTVALALFGFARPAVADETWSDGKLQTVSPRDGKFPVMVSPRSGGDYTAWPLDPVYAMQFAEDRSAIYCADYALNAGRSYSEVADGAEAGVTSGAAGVEWIARHSIPALTVDEVLAQVGATSADLEGLPGSGQDFLTADYLVRAVTQAAIWEARGQGKGDVVQEWMPEFEGYQPNGSGPTSMSQAKTWTEAGYTTAAKLYAFFVDGAASGGAPAEPALKIATPGESTAPVDGKVGPFTVTASGVASIEVAVNGGRLVDADGAAVSVVEDGTVFYVTSDTAAEAKVTLKGAGKTTEVHWFSAGAKTQPMVFATSTSTEVKAEASATFTTPTEPAPPEEQTPPSEEQPPAEEPAPREPAPQEPAPQEPAPQESTPEEQTPVVVAATEDDAPAAKKQLGPLIETDR